MRSFCVLVMAITSCGSSNLTADDLYLKNGIILHGVALRVPGLSQLTARQNNQGPVPNFPYWMVDDGVRRVFVHTRQVADEVGEEELSSIISFQLPQTKTGRSLALGNIDAFSYVEPFDANGRRVVSFETRKGPLNVIQGITRIRPDYFQVEGLTHVWEYGLDTRTIPDDVLQKMIANASDRSDPVERRAAVQFYLTGKLYTLAQSELESIIRDFPEEQARCEELLTLIAEEKARGALVEIQQRRRAGQHALAYQIARLFPPERVSADVLREAQDIVAEYDAARLNRDRAEAMLTQLESQLTPEEAEQVRPLRSIVKSEMHYENLARLEPFLRAEQDATLSAAQKLALAYSGWVLGAEHAVVALPQAIRCWEARFLTLEFLRNSDNPFRRDELANEIDGLEGIGIDQIAQLVPNLPPFFEPSNIAAGHVLEVNVPGTMNEPSCTYSITLPPEYSPHKKYPLLVVLTSALRTPADEVHWWAGDETRPGWAQRRGYIVVAPHYCDATATSHDYGETSHAVVLKSIDHVRGQYRIDSDRIFLGGHGMGGDACFDIGMSHPGIFAGIIPFTGISDRFCMFYSYNDPHVAWYVVSGQRDRESLDRNARDMNKIMTRGQDAIYCQYKERGYESYYEEQPRIFEWMETQRRVQLTEVLRWGETGRVVSLRKTDNRFYWMQADALREELFSPIAWENPQRKVRPTEYSGSITPGGTIRVKHPGRATTIWLNPEMVNFDERLRIHVNGDSKFYDFITPSIAHLLEELRLHPDRERLYWARMEL